MKIIAYTLSEAAATMPIIPARRSREWMDQLPEGFANRCLPLRIANESGWWILNNADFSAAYHGGAAQKDLEVTYDNGYTGPRLAASHFGSGILTFKLPYIFRTPPGYNLHVRGPANWPKYGTQALEGIVETDWSYQTFTMNWQMTSPTGEDVFFEKGEPICQVAPLRRGELESWETALGTIEDDPDLRERYLAWSGSRSSFLTGLKNREEEALARKWQKDYFQGRTAETSDAPRFLEHQTKLHLRPFFGIEPPA